MDIDWISFAIGAMVGGVGVRVVVAVKLRNLAKERWISY